MKFNQYKLFLILCVAISLNAKAQKEANNWYFGNGAGITFNSGSPVPISGSQLFTTEGCSSISDANGNLLFYTDGITVWNQNHLAMPNGNGLNGNVSSTQSALIVQKPGSQNLYYIFVIDIDFRYSIVDMSLQGGLGDVSQKNSLILAGCASEKQCATYHSNGNDIWIMMHTMNSNIFNAYLLTSSGLTMTPVVSTIGMVHSSPYGQMKFSPNGNRLALGVYNTGPVMELFDFDKSTGLVSNNLPITTTYQQCYGLEFSPDNSKLYGTANPSFFDVYQWDLNAGSPSAILASATLIGTSGSSTPAGMQLAPDGKIYLSPMGSGYLDVISDPNVAGTGCNFIHNAVLLSSGNCQLGLPEFLSSYFNAVQYENTCFGDSTHFFSGNSNLAGAQWNFGDTLSGANNQSSLFNPAHLFSAPGIYDVQLISYALNGGTDTVTMQVEIISMPQNFLAPDTTICSGSTYLIDAGTGYDTYLWQDGSTASTYTANGAGIYAVTITKDNCSSVDSIEITEVPCLQPNVAFSSSDTSFCEKNCIDFFDLSTNNPTSWLWFFPGADSTSSTLQNPTNICYNSYGSFDVTLIACNAVSCDTLVMTNFINEYSSPVITITVSADTLYASNASNYQWYEVSSGLISGAVNSYYVYQQPGSYYCVISDSIGCIATSNIITISGQNELNTISDFTVYPNPGNGTFNIAINNLSLSGTSTFSLINNVGQCVYKSTLSSLITKFELTLAEGIYMAEVENDKVVIRKKLIVKY